MNQETVFVINSGSSSLKYQLLDPVTGNILAKGLAERIGSDAGVVTHSVNGTAHTETLPLPTHTEALNRVIRYFSECGPNLNGANMVAIGHRIVQGGPYFHGPALIDDKVRNQIDELSDLGPLHNPAHLLGIDSARQMWPDLPHIAVFDTAFFADLPEKTRTYALDKEVAKHYKIRRYGAHGTSHQYVSGLVCDHLGNDTVKQITLHLGNGASACAELGRTAMDTSMGLTPLEGLVMGTRTGDIDPAVVFHLQRVAGMSVDEVDTLFNKKSGMKGMTGESDMRSVWDMIHNDEDPEAQQRARVAMDVYINRLLKYVGSYTAELGGLDVITFTAGIGENDAAVRRELAEALAPFGVKIDVEANQVRSGEPRVISAPDSSVTIYVFPTNEELAIARQALTFA